MSSKPIAIREATSADLSSILTLCAQLDLKGDEHLSLKRAQELFARIQSYPDYHIYVAVNDGTIVGTFALLIMDNLAHKGTPSGIVEDVVVHRDWQGRGLGKQMMEYAMLKCREAGCYKLVLSSNVSRERAHKFYESLGFKRHGYSFTVDLDA
ncbi:MAG: GNAT family N-acetyltransferase [Candidatus Eisenbacteria bacterium]|nr:GNAT family N-acetyltransferase [Candidatus Eisenbacteria bacterium]